MRHANEELRNIRVSGPLIVAGGQRQLLTVYDDVTEALRHEQAILELNINLEERIQERTAELNAAKMVVEQASIGLTHLMRNQALRPQALDRLTKIGNAAKHLLGIINDILDLSKIEAGKLAIHQIEFSLDGIVQRVADMVRERAAAKNLEIIIDVDHLPPFLRGDETRLGQILLNFVGNAVKFTDIGQVIMRCRIVGSGSTDEHILIRFEVIDTGIRLSVEQQLHLLEAFEQGDVSTTRKYGGMELGLAISIATR